MTAPSWSAARKHHLQALHRFIVPREEWCIPLAGILADRRPLSNNRVLVCCNGRDIIAAVQIKPSGELIPVLSDLYLREYARVRPHFTQLPDRPFSIMGKASSVDQILRWYGGITGRTVSYHIMRRPVKPSAPAAAVPGITVQRVGRDDTAALYPLQKGYEIEEVLLDPGLFNERACRANLEKLLSVQHVFAARDASGAFLSKANTNAQGITCEQIGGVYTLPSCRGRGLGLMVLEELVRDVSSRQRKTSLFVKRENSAAVNLYRRIGFDILGDFAITYPGRGSGPSKLSVQA